MKEKGHIFAPICGVLITCMLGLTLAIISCTNTSCDGLKCKQSLGLEGKTSERDSIFRANNLSNANNFNVYVESSASMDGYVTGNTRFKTTLHRLIGQVIADVLVDDNHVNLNYITTEITKKDSNPKVFTQSLSPSSFSGSNGDRANSDIIEIISSVVKSTSKGDVSMFVSDCVYSPEPSADIDKALKKQQTDMLNILKNKSKKDSSFGVLLYRMTSDFHGIYYTKTNSHINCNGQRPYFIWFFGDESILANVHESISKIMKEEKADYIVGIPGYKYLPYKTIKSDHAYHYLSAKSREDSIFTFSFYADMRPLPLTSDYIVNKANYGYGKNKYYIKKIETVTQSDGKADGYNYRYTVAIRGGKNAMITPTIVDISLNSMLKEVPNWVLKYDDPIGEDYDRGYDPNKLRTFGLKSLVEGVVDFYKEPSYVSFKIQIN